MKQRLELPQLRYSLLLKAKENKNPQASAAVLMAGGLLPQKKYCKDTGNYCSSRFKMFSLYFSFKNSVVGLLFSYV